ncbi:unnamed protein product [Peniophora sp. CBMAI 1063]|nr:unnamed protein product [Peniophora sp. CBMAI 1063]
MSLEHLDELSDAISEVTASTEYLVVADGKDGLSRSSTPTVLNACARHERFYLDDGSLTFIMPQSALVYRVHGSLFAAHSPLWKAKIDDQGIYAQVELKNIDTRDLNAFLSVLYPRSHYAPEERTTADWISILRMAHQWEFPDIRSLAIEKLRDLAPPVERLVLARDFNIPTWVETARSELYAREEPLSTPEAKRLDMADVVKIFTTREAALAAKVETLRKALDPRGERSVRDLFDDN